MRNRSSVCPCTNRMFKTWKRKTRPFVTPRRKKRWPGLRAVALMPTRERSLLELSPAARELDGLHRQMGQA